MDDGVQAALAASSFARLPAPAIQRLLARSRVVRTAAGSVTHREGEAAEHLELVVDGLVRVFVTAPDGRTLTVRYCRRGALIGAVSLYATGFRMPAGIQAVVDARLLHLCPDVVRRAAAEDPRVADALLHELADRVLSFIHEITGSAFSSVRQRVARHRSPRRAAGGLARPGDADRSQRSHRPVLPLYTQPPGAPDVRDPGAVRSPVGSTTYSRFPAPGTARTDRWIRRSARA